MFGLLENRFLAKPAPMDELFSLGQTTPKQNFLSVWHCCHDYFFIEQKPGLGCTNQSLIETTSMDVRFSSEVTVFGRDTI